MRGPGLPADHLTCLGVRRGCCPGRADVSHRHSWAWPVASGQLQSDPLSLLKKPGLGASLAGSTLSPTRADLGLPGHRSACQGRIFRAGSRTSFHRWSRGCSCPVWLEGDQGMVQTRLDSLCPAHIPNTGQDWETLWCRPWGEGSRPKRAASGPQRGLCSEKKPTWEGKIKGNGPRCSLDPDAFANV